MKYFTQKELKKLFKVIEGRRESGYRFWLRDLAMFNLGYVCGLRASEVGRLRVEYFNEPRGEIFCSRLKNSISNTIRLDEKRRKLMKKYVREYHLSDGPLFLSRKRQPISRRQLDKLMKIYASGAKLPEDKAHWHTLKHSIAVHLAESGADIKELQNYLGHKKVDSTLVYFKFTTKQQDEFYKKIRGNPQIV